MTNVCWVALLVALAGALLSLAVTIRNLRDQARFRSSELTAANNRLLQEIEEHKGAQVLLRVQRDLAMTSRPTLSESLDWMLEALMQIPEVDSGGVYLLSPEDAGFDLVAHRGLSKPFVDAFGKIESGSSLDLLVSAGKTVTARYRELMRDRNVRVEESEGLRACAIIPIKNETRVIGALNMASHTVKVFSAETVSTLEGAAMQIGGILARLQAEKRDRQNRTNLEMLLHRLEDLVFIVGLDGRIRHANPSVSRTLGYGECEIAGMPLATLYPQEFEEEVKTMWFDTQTGRNNTCLVPLRTRSGDWLAVETKVTPGEWNGVPVKVGISREFTDSRFLLKNGAAQGC